MDVVRTCYARPATFFRDSGTEAKIKWFRAPVGARTFPTPHKWSSLFWYKNPWNATGIGEAEGKPYQYKKGFTPLTVDGLRFCGTLEEFQNGCKFDPSVNVQRDVWGIPTCCGVTDPNVVTLEDPDSGIVLTESGDAVEIE